MAFDSFMLAAVTQELQALCGARINKIYQPDRFTVIFKLHADRNYKLKLSAHPQNAGIYLSTAESENPAKAPVFCMVLRKYLENARITAIEHIQNERIAVLHFSFMNELGDEDSCRLVVEIMGKHSNIILIDHDNRIIDGIRRYTHAVSRYRQILPNESYIAPPPQQKQEWRTLSAEELLGVLLEQNEGEAACEKALLATFAGLSPFAARDIAARAGLERQSVEEMGLYEGERLFAALHFYDETTPQPCLLQQDGAAKDIYFIRPQAWQELCEDQRQGYSLREFGTVNELCDFFDSIHGSEESFAAKKRELLKLVRGFAEKSGKKLAAQREELATAQNGDEWKEKGDLLSANLWQVQKGMSELTVSDFYHENEPCRIELDPALTPQENLSRFYRRYNKLKNAAKEIVRQVEATDAEHEYLLSVEASVEDAESITELEAIKDELRDGGYLREQRRGTQKPKALPPLEFFSSDGFRIMVGRNNRQNDLLTLKLAAQNDIWLHTQKIHGSHVIIRTEGNAVPERTLYEAASLAALHSKARGGGKAPVDYTEVSQVKKPNGAKPGMVIYFRQQTILADAEDARASFGAEHNQIEE